MKAPTVLAGGRCPSTHYIGGNMELTYLDGLRVARALAKENKMQTLDGLIEVLESGIVETASIAIEMETR